MFFKKKNDNNIDDNDKNVINIESVENNNNNNKKEKRKDVYKRQIQKITADVVKRLWRILQEELPTRLRRPESQLYLSR